MSATTDAKQRARETTSAFFDAYRQHDVEKMVQLCSPEGELHYVPMGRQGEGKLREQGRAIWSQLIDAFPDLSNRVQSLFADDQGDVAAEVVIGGTQQKDFGPIPNRGRHYDLPHAFVFSVGSDGLITKLDAYWDNASFFSQLGLHEIPEMR